MLEFTKDCVWFGVGSWHVAFYFNPRVWGIDWHRNAACCKFWLVFGPFELGQHYTEAEYKEQYPDLEDEE